MKNSFSALDPGQHYESQILFLDSMCYFLTAYVLKVQKSNFSYEK